MTFRPSLKKITHFFPLSTWQIVQNLRYCLLIFFYFFRLEAISLLPFNPSGHAAYQDTFVSNFLKFYPDPFVLPKSTWDYIVQFWFLDLSQTDSIMQECYSVFGPVPRLPSCMLRSFLLTLKLKVTSITLWCRMLRETPLYALPILSSDFP